MADLCSVIVPAIDEPAALAPEPAFGIGTGTVALDVGCRTVGAVVDGQSDVITITPE